VNERRTVVGGLIGHCVSPPPWREIDAHDDSSVQLVIYDFDSVFGFAKHGFLSVFCLFTV